MQTQSIVLSSSPPHTLTVMLTQAGANPAAKQQTFQKLFPAGKSVRITGHRALGHFGNPAWVGQVCSCHRSESAGEPGTVAEGQTCNRLLHPHLLPILVLQEARADSEIPIGFRTKKINYFNAENAQSKSKKQDTRSPEPEFWAPHL